MSSVAERFDKFLSNIQLTSSQIEDARTKYDGVCKKLHDNYYLSSYNGSTKLLAGSYGKNTAIAPPTDIDVLFIMPSSFFQRYDSYSWNGQSKLLQDIKSILKDRYPSTDMRGDGQVVMVNFASYNVEVVPSFLLTNGNYYIPDTHDGGRWKEISPKSEMNYIIQSNKRSNGNTVKLIKMIKAWKYYCDVPIKSLVIELRSVNFLNKYKYFDKTSIYYDFMIRDFFKELVDYLDETCKIPGIDEKISYGDEWESKAKTAISRAEKACKFELDKDYLSATMEWKKIFGDRFNF